MSTVQLYCRPGCATCGALARYLDQGGVAAKVHDVTAESAAFGTVLELGYRSLPVLMGPASTAAAGANADRLARRLPAGQAAPASSKVDQTTSKGETR